jgi:hypothetical protein
VKIAVFLFNLLFYTTTPTIPGFRARVIPLYNFAAKMIVFRLV